MNTSVPNITALVTSPDRGYPEGVRILLIILGVSYTVIGVPGNLAVMNAVMKSRRLRTRLNTFILNLCATDLVAIGYTYPFVLYDLIAGYHPVSLSWCRVNISIQNSCSMSSYVSVIAIAVSRYVKVCRPDRFEMLFSKKMTAIYCFMSWTPALLLSVYDIINTEAVIYQKGMGLCHENVTELSPLKLTALIVFNASYVIVLRCYAGVWRILRESGLALEGHSTTRNAILKHEADKRLTSASFVIFVMFIFLTMPAVLVFTITIPTPNYVYGITVSLFFSNSAMNSIIYGGMNKGIIRYYKTVFSKLRCQQLQASVEPTSVYVTQ